ncbi:MAG: hypothetical protein ACI853_001566 [Paracoccaceae bacterium]|jgi:hypothetical protein
MRAPSPQGLPFCATLNSGLCKAAYPVKQKRDLGPKPEKPVCCVGPGGAIIGSNPPDQGGAVFTKCGFQIAQPVSDRADRCKGRHDLCQALVFCPCHDVAYLCRADGGVAQTCAVAGQTILHAFCCELLRLKIEVRHLAP